MGEAQQRSFERIVDRALAVQRPAVVAHIRSLRLRHPNADPERLIRLLEHRYLLAVTGGGAAVGATAVLPAISTPYALALSGVETLGFLEATALFAQSVAEVHGIHVEDPHRARLLVMTLMLGEEGTQLLAQFTGQVLGKGPGRAAFWGELVTKTLPRTAVGPVLDRLQHAFLKHFGAIGGASFLGKALPFGIGAAVGATGNHVLGSRVVRASRRAFGPAPLALSDELAPRVGAERFERRMLRGARTAGGSIAAGVGALAGLVPSVRRRRAPDERRSAVGRSAEDLSAEGLSAEELSADGLSAADAGDA